MTRTVADGALMMSVISGPHPLDQTSQEAWPAYYVGRLDDGVKGGRVAFSMYLGHARVDPEVAARVRRAAKNFEANGGFSPQDVTSTWRPVGSAPIRDFSAAHMTSIAALLPRFESQTDPGLVACIKDGGDVTLPQNQDMRVRKVACDADIHT